MKHREIAVGRRIEAALRILNAVSFLSAMALVACRSDKTQETPSIAFTKILPAAEGGRENVDTIGGRVKSARQDSRLLSTREVGRGGCSPGD